MVSDYRPSLWRGQLLLTLFTLFLYITYTLRTPSKLPTYMPFAVHAYTEYASIVAGSLWYIMLQCKDDATMMLWLLPAPSLNLRMLEHVSTFYTPSDFFTQIQNHLEMHGGWMKKSHSAVCSFKVNALHA